MSSLTRQFSKALRSVGGKATAPGRRMSSQAYPTEIICAPDTEISYLKNGMRVATEATPGPLASLCVAINAGTRYETASTNGTSSLIKHLAFKGQEAAVAALGGVFSVEVGREATLFKATVASADASKALEILSNATKVHATETAAEAAKGALLCELAAANKQPEERVFDHLHDAAFLGSSLSLPVLGTYESVTGLTAASASSWAARHYATPLIVVAAAGNVDHAALSDQASSLWPGLGEQEVVELPACPFVGSDKRMRFDSKPVAHVAFAFKGPPSTSEYVLPLQLIQSVMGAYDVRSNIGNNGASRWTLPLAEIGCAVYATPFYIPYNDVGLFGVYGVAKDTSLENFMWYSLTNLLRICHKVSDEEVERAKIALKTNHMSLVATTDGVAADIARQVSSLNRRLHPSELFSRIDALSTDDVKEAGTTFINDQDHALAAVGPIYELPDYNWIRRRSYMLRY